jgi:hypothetical protein
LVLISILNKNIIMLYIMSVIGLTSLVVNPNSSKQLGRTPFYYRYRSCSPNFPNRTQTNVGGFTPADQYQKLKLMQNTVRVMGSLYTANLAPLSAYAAPINAPSEGFYGVNWNQMSDRPVASVQRASIPTGSNNALNRRHTSVTSSKPGNQTPGGIGCDIKHNSYDRYLNRLKGKKALRRGVIPAAFGKPIVFNPALPVYGGKTTKTNIVNGYNCPVNECLQQDVRIYNNPLWQPYPVSSYDFKVGDYVYARKDGNDYYEKAQVIAIDGDDYTVQFEDDSTQITNVSLLLVYFSCNCYIPTKPSQVDPGIDCKLSDYSLNMIYLINNY